MKVPKLQNHKKIIWEHFSIFQITSSIDYWEIDYLFSSKRRFLYKIAFIKHFILREFIVMYFIHISSTGRLILNSNCLISEILIIITRDFSFLSTCWMGWNAFQLGLPSHRIIFAAQSIRYFYSSNCRKLPDSPRYTIVFLRKVTDYLCFHLT